MELTLLDATLRTGRGRHRILAGELRATLDGGWLLVERLEPRELLELGPAGLEIEGAEFPVRLGRVSHGEPGTGRAVACEFVVEAERRPD